jgi:hypothetical protein
MRERMRENERERERERRREDICIYISIYAVSEQYHDNSKIM